MKRIAKGFLNKARKSLNASARAEGLAAKLRKAGDNDISKAKASHAKRKKAIWESGKNTAYGEGVQFKKEEGKLYDRGFNRKEKSWKLDDTAADLKRRKASALKRGAGIALGAGAGSYLFSKKKKPSDR